MNIIISTLIIATLIIAAVCLHYKLVKLKTVSDFERTAAAKMHARSHRLVVQRQEIDLMPQGYAKLHAHDEWIGSVYSYMEDYEANVVEEMRKSKFDGVKAYGGIRLV